MSDRRTGRGPGGPRRPARSSAAARSARPAPVAGPAEEARPRPTGRALILVLLLAVLAVSYASSMKAYLQQRAHIAELKQQIDERSESIDDLEREKRRWNDDAYVRAQARARFGYLMPGETAYVVLDEKGKPLETRSELHDPRQVLREPPEPWWDDAWSSMELAGHPPRDPGTPAAELGAPAE